MYFGITCILSVKHYIHDNEAVVYLQDLLERLKETQDVKHLLPFNHDQRRGAGWVTGLYTSLRQESHNGAPGRLLHHTA